MNEKGRAKVLIYGNGTTPPPFLAIPSPPSNHVAVLLNSVGTLTMMQREGD